MRSVLGEKQRYQAAAGPDFENDLSAISSLEIVYSMAVLRS